MSAFLLLPMRKFKSLSVFWQTGMCGSLIPIQIHICEFKRRNESKSHPFQVALCYNVYFLVKLRLKWQKCERELLSWSNVSNRYAVNCCTFMYKNNIIIIILLAGLYDWWPSSPLCCIIQRHVTDRTQHTLHHKLICRHNPEKQLSSE